MSEFVNILATVAFAYLVKGVAGMGGPLLAIPVIATFTGVEHAVVVLSLASLVSNGWLMWEHRDGWEGTGDILIPFLGVGVVATIAGTWLLTSIDDRILSIVVALVIVAYIVRFVTDPQFHIQASTARRWAAPAGAAGGILIGATGTGGPLVTTYLHSIRMRRSSFLFALALTFQVLGPIQLVTLLGLGAFTPERTAQALWAIVPVVVMTPLGILLGRRLPQRGFELTILALLAFAAIRLVWSAVA